MMNREKLMRFCSTNAVYLFHAAMTVVSARLFDLEGYYTPFGMFVYFSVTYLVVGYLLMFNGAENHGNGKK